MPEFYPNLSLEEEKRLHTLYVRRAFLVYLSRIASFRKSEAFVVHFGPGKRGEKPSTASLSHSIRTLIALAYGAVGQIPLKEVQGRSTPNMSASVAELQGASIVEICRAATWVSASTFINHY